jgi:CubicO group peptidase (beta-lactamase class C family)
VTGFVAGPDELAGFVTARMRADRIPGLSIVVVSDGSVRWSAAFGVADLAARAPARPGTPYLWFSMTKIATATAVVRLAEQGLVDLDAPVSAHFPPFAVADPSRAVTVRHLLSHTSGLVNPIPVRWVYPASSSPPDRVAFVERLLRRHSRLRGTPGTRCRYSNLGYLVLGEVIAHASGRPYERYLREELLAPLGMAHTGFTYAETGPERPATGYQRLPAGLTPLLRAVLPTGIIAGRYSGYVAYHPFYVMGAPYGGLVGDAADAARVALLHLGDGAVDGTRLLSPRAAADMRHTLARGGPTDVGLGWFRPSGGRTDFVEHLGGGSGFFSVMRLYPDRDVGVVMMGNTTRYDHEAILDRIVDPRVPA